MSELLFQTGAECRNDAGHKIGELLRNFNNRLALNNLRLVERYIKGEISLLVHFHLGLKISHQYIAHIHWAGCPRDPKEGIHLGAPLQARGMIEEPLPSEVPRHHPADVEAARIAAARQDDSVLVQVVQAVQDPELMPIPSLVRFERLESLERVIPNTALYCSIKSGLVFAGSIADRKVELLVSDFNTKPDAEQLVSQVIEGAPKVLDNVADERGDVSRGGCEFSDLVVNFSRLRIFLSNDSIGVRVKECADGGIKISDVLFGPFNFYANQGEPLIGVHDLANYA